MATNWKQLLKDANKLMVPEGVSQRDAKTIIRIAEAVFDSEYSFYHYETPATPDRLDDLTRKGLLKKNTYFGRAGYQETTYEFTPAAIGIIHANN